MYQGWKGMAVGFGLGFALGATPMLAELAETSGNTPRGVTPATSAAPATVRTAADCARERAWLEAEEAFQGTLQWLAREAAGHCEALVEGQQLEPGVTPER